MRLVWDVLFERRVGCGALALWAALAVLPVSAGAQLTERVLLADRPSATLTVYTHPVTNNIFSARQAQTGATPESIAVAPNGRIAFVANQNSAYISVVDLTISAEVRRLRPYLASSLAVSPDGTRLLAALQGGTDTEQIAIFDTSNFALLAKVDLNGLLDDDPALRNSLVGSFAFYGGDEAYLTTLRGAVARLNYRTYSVTKVSGTQFGFYPLSSSIAIAPAQDWVFAASWSTGRIFAINPATGMWSSQIDIPNWLVWGIAAAPAPSDNTMTYLYVLATPPGAPGSSLKVFDVTGTPGSNPQWGMQVKPDAGTLFNFATNTSVLNNGVDMALSSDGRTLYLSQAAFTFSANAGQVNVATNPIDASTRYSTLGESLGALVVAKTQAVPPAAAPVITHFEPATITNDTDNWILIQGANFASDAQVRIGSLDPVTPFFNSSTELRLFLPRGIPAQSARIVVTNPNTTMPPSDQWMSGIAGGALTIGSSPSFQPKHQVGVVNYGDETGSLLNYSTSAGVVTSPRFLHNPIAVAMSGDGIRAYVLSGSPVEFFVWNFVTMRKEAQLWVTPYAPGVFESIAWTPTNAFTPTRGPAVFLVGATFRPGPGLFDNNLFVYDADPTSSTYNTLTPLAANLPWDAFAPGGLAATANGNYAFTLEGPLSPVFPPGHLLRWDVGAGTATVCGVNLPSLGITTKPWAVRLVNGRYLLMSNSSGRLVLMQVVPSGSDPATTPPACPASGQILSPVLPAGGPYNYRVLGNRLYVFAGGANVVQIYNFDPVGNDFSLLGSYTITGTVGADPGFEVTPDGTLIYVGQSESDTVVVLDSAAITSASPGTALQTSFRTGINPLALAFRPGVVTPVGTDVVVQPVAGVTIKFSSVNGAGETTVTTTNTPAVPPPQGFNLEGTPIFYDVTTTASVTPPIVLCFPAPPGVSAPLELLHFDNTLVPPGWVRVTVPAPPDAPPNSVCGQVSSLSPFVVGWGTPEFHFDSLVSQISSSVSHSGTMKSLRAKLLAARASYERGQNSVAYNQLQALQEEIRAQSGKNIDAATAENLLSEVSTLIGLL